MYFYPGKIKTYIRAFNKGMKLRFQDSQMTLPGLVEMQSQQFDGKKRTARSAARTERILAAESASNLDFFGFSPEPVLLRALVLAARMTPVYRNSGS